MSTRDDGDQRKAHQGSASSCWGGRGIYLEQSQDRPPERALISLDRSAQEGLGSPSENSSMAPAALRMTMLTPCLTAGYRANSASNSTPE